MNAGPEDITDQTDQVPEAYGHTLPDAVNAAELLLAYVAEQGSDIKRDEIEKADIQTVVHAKHTLIERALNEEEESEFWDAYRRLCVATRPVSRESLEATKALLIPRKWFGTRNVSVASNAVRYYQGITITSIITLLIFQIYWVFISTLVMDVSRLRNKLIEFNVEFDTEKAELRNIEASKEDDQIIEKDTLDRLVRLKLETEASWIERSHKVEELTRQYHANLTLLIQSNVLGRIIYEDADEIHTSFEGQPVLIKTGSISLEVMSLYLLPILYGLVGACAYILRNLSEQIRDRTFTSASKIRLQLRMVLGALAGLSIAWFAKSEGGVSFLENITPLALAFLAGYSVELLFSAMDTLIRAFSPDRPSV